MNRLVLYKSTSLIPRQTGSSVQAKQPESIVWEEPYHPKRETLRLTSLDVVFVGPIIHFVIDRTFPVISVPVLFLRNALYCVCLTGLFVDRWVSPLVMATAGYIAGVYEVRLFRFGPSPDTMATSTVNALVSIKGMTMFLLAAQWTRELTNPPLVLNVIYALLWIRSLVFQRGACNVCNVFNLCSWISVILAAMLSSAVYSVIQSEFKDHPFVHYLDMVVCSHLLGLVPRQGVEFDVEDNFVLLVIRSTFGWVTVAAHRLLRDMFLAVMVYIPLLALIIQELGRQK